ncbi:alpha-L-arabinofuranosidase C-terminal domain-containing protein [Arthrobacter sp. HS15c]|uniref:alpha-L-arabinofuranosidase C-terminal domain-containing protein n=1 Tax=Arthrobacter sp. HS15c TaxID=3230279 RepID=UPI003465F1FB
MSITQSFRKAPQQHAATISVRTGEPGPQVSPTLYGLFLEDINFACDGGLNANMVNNHSFDGVYLDRRLYSDRIALFTKRRPRRKIDRTRHWVISDGRLASSRDDAPAQGQHFGRVTSFGTAKLENPGYPGERPGMALKRGQEILFRSSFRNREFRGEIEVQLLDSARSVAASKRFSLQGNGWTEIRLGLVPLATGLGSLRIVFDGEGVVDIDEVSLVPADHWGAGDVRWSQGLLRRDLVESLAALRPTFLRFPGGCIVEGAGDGNQYNWKKTVGPLRERRTDYNLWGAHREDGDYTQSNQVGFYEYFLLCEDLGMEPIPVVWAGMACQFRSNECASLDDAEFEQAVADAVDLIDWATADPATSKWAALRAEAGHPEPFVLNYVGIGNENFGPAYIERFTRIKEAMEARRGGITYVLSAGYRAEGKDFERAWSHANDDPGHTLVDEHFYRKPEWFLKAATRYDDYPRTGARVFAGEYAAHVSAGLIPVTKPVNTWRSALAEAAFLTGVERNSDIVSMTCPAPLLKMVEHEQWAHNLIDFNPTSVLPTANYLVHQLFSTRIGDRIVAVRGGLPDGVFASSTATEEMLHLKLVNTNPAPIDIRVEVGEGPKTALLRSLSGSPDEANSLAFDGEPVLSIQDAEWHLAVEDGAISLRLEGHSVVAASIPQGP